MNYAGKFDANLSADGSGLHTEEQGHGRGHVETITTHAIHAPADAIIVPDSQLLFNGDFKRSGVDLVLTKDEHELVLHDYFRGEKRAALSSPDGAHLTGDIVSALTGYTQYAQADGSGGAGHVIGHVTKLAGTATVIRNGVSVILNMGDNVEKSDVVQSGANSTLGVTFIDGSVFGLSSNARMVLNEMVYDPNGSNNASLISLVAGTISFVAGETAKHGDMKVDTPVATMGIRGTAVLCEIDFDVPGQGGAPEAHFQVLIEPDGTTGSYILFDKQTLAPLAVANIAGQQINIGQYGVNVTNSPLSPDVQKLIGDVFTLRFSDSNTKTFDHFTDSIIPQSLAPIQLANLITATPVVLSNNGPVDPTAKFVLPPTSGPSHIAGPPKAAAFGNAFVELAGKTHDAGDLDTVSGNVNYNDINAGDVPSVTTSFSGYTYQDAAHNDLKPTLDALQLADIKAIEVALLVAQDPNGKNFGSANWTYSVPDSAFDFLAAGETLTLTYTADVDNNFALNPEHTFVTFTITIIGTNDVPVITSSAPTISFAAGKTTPGGDLIATVANSTSGTLAFTDVDLTDTHTVSTALTKVQFLGTVPPTPLAAFETALSAAIAADSTGTGSGTISWKFADLPVYLADFIPVGETVTLTYTVTLEDHSATDPNLADFLSSTTQTITVTIKGTAAAAEVWIATTAAGTHDWNTGTNWETGLVPTASDDAIIITNQLQGFTPLYPVTINAAAGSSQSKPDAVAKSLTMNDFGSTAPELDNKGILKIGGGINLSADSILKNFGTLSIGALAQLLSVDGRAEILNKSVLQNSGSITLYQGGDFQDQSTITNSGTIEVAGGTLNVLVDVGNSGGIVQVDDGATLALKAAIDHGTVTNHGGGEIDLAGTAALTDGTLNNSGLIKVSGSGNVLGGIHGGETVSNSGAGFIDITGDLTLNFATVTNVDASSAETVEAAASLTLQDTSSITGGTVNNNGTLNLQDSSALKNGALNNTAAVNAKGANTLDTESVTNTGTIDVTGTLTVKNTTISNATDEVHNTGLLKVEAGARVDLSGATIQHGSVSVLVGGEIVTVAGTSNSIETPNGPNDNTSVVSFDIAGVLAVSDNSSLTVSSPFNIDNSGTIELNSSGDQTYLYIDQSFAGISGGGNITLSNNTNNIIAATTSGDQLTNFDNTISGAGEIGAKGLVLVNGNDGSGGSGVIDANANNVLLLDPTTLTNAALIEATIGGTLKLSGSIVTNFLSANSGEFLTDATSTFDVVTSSVTGGTVANAGTLNLQGNAALKSGKLGNTGQINVTGTGNALDGESVTANHALEIMAGAALLIDQGSSIANSGGTITIDGAATANGEGILTLSGTEITGGTINDYSLGADHTTILAGKIDVTGSSTIDGGAHLNNGNVTLEQGVSLKLDNVMVSGTDITNKGGIELDHNVTLTGGATIQGQSPSTLGVITNLGTLEVTGLATLLDDTLTNDGHNVQIDISSTLDFSSSTITGGTLTISGELDSTGTSFITGVDITNTGAFDVTGGTLAIDATSSFSNAGSLNADGGTFTVDADITGTGYATIDGGTFEIGIGATDAQTVNFSGPGTLQLDDLTSFSGKVTGLAAGDVIDLANTTVTTAVWNGLTLTINGTPTAFTVANLPAGDTFGFKSDGHGGTDLAVLPQVETAGSSPASGVEGTPITLHFTDALTAAGTAESATLASFVISGIPTGATLADAYGHLLTISNGTVTLDQAQLAAGILTGLTITPGNDTNFTLSAVAIATDNQQYEYTVPVTETVTVNPLAPSLAPVAESGVEGTAIALNLGITVNALPGDSNSLSSLVVSAIPIGAVLSDGHGDIFKATSGHTTSPDIHSWHLSNLTITPPTDADFTLSIAATEQDAQGNHSATTTATEAVTVYDTPRIVCETDPSIQTVILDKSPIVLAPEVNTNSLGLPTETFDGHTAGSASNNGFGFGTFDSHDLNAKFTASGDAGVVNGSSSVSAAPFVGPSPGHAGDHADTTNYLSVGAHGTETITFATEENAFGLYWGSVDSFNTVVFYNGDGIVASYTGADISPLLASGSQGSFSSNGYVEFSDLAPFNKVVLGSSSNAFEIDNISAGFVSDSHVHLAAPMTGTLTVSDDDIGDTLTASVTGNAVVEYNGSTTLPTDANVAALINHSAITFDSVKTTGGPDVLDWTYNPGNADLDFLEPGDTLTVTFNAQVNNGHATSGNQPLTVTIVGTGASVVNGTSQNDTFLDVGGGVTIFGHGGHDTFVFNPNFNNATIGDFNVSNDTIQIDKSLFATVTALLASAQSANSGHDTVITDAAHDTITLAGVPLAAIKAHPNDFHLV